MRQLKNYPDSRCVYGYMTLCNDCVGELREDPTGFRHVDVAEPIRDYYPHNGRCERCLKKGT